ncbi:mechanosensitive ion channel [Stieleria sp. TO1_6]|uniref:mechanosensitive ion channel domain-containing protein n=1 Tax=Stieleria tagensis TaxID=2956795 RepID=UPI00209A781D|nr:mechanosensitive ion channel domain-containing protein [Stieleria tagensis]MCO8120113.1 mechanosensitive ion channel [Stieleria tagensis]
MPAILLFSSIAGSQEAVSQNGVVAASFTDRASPTPDETPIAISKQLVEKEQSAIASAGLSETQQPECEARLTKALALLSTADEEIARRASFESQSKAIPETLAKLRSNLAAPAQAAEISLPADPTVAQLESQLVQLKQHVEALEVDLAAKKKESDGRPARLQDIAKEVIELQKRIATNREQLTPVAPVDVEARTKWFEQAARLSHQLQLRERLQSERRYLEAATELLSLQTGVVQRDLKEQSKQLAAFQSAVEAWRKDESQRQAEVARRTAEQAHPALRSLAEGNTAIAEARIHTASGIQKIGRQVKTLTDLSKTLAEEFEDLRQKVEYAGATSSTGVLLRKKRSELPDTQEFYQRDAFVKEEMPRVHLQLMEWKKLQRESVDPDELAQKMIDESADLRNRFETDQVSRVVARLLEDRRVLLTNAIPDQGTYLQDLNDLDFANQTLQKEVTAFRQFLDQRILWMRSDDMLNGDDFQQATTGMGVLLGKSRWNEVARVACGDIARRPAIGLGVLALFALIMLFRAKLLSIQRDLAERPAAGEQASFGRYVSAFAITFLIAGRWPVLLLAFGYRLKTAADATPWTQSVGDACLTTVVLVWSCEFLREIARVGGIAETLFQWPEAATRSLRRTLRATFLFGTPLIALLQLAHFGELAETVSLHRLLFILSVSLFVFQIGVLLMPNGSLMNSIAARSPNAFLFRARRLIWCGAVAAPGGFAVLSILGYHYSAYQLSGRLAETGAAIVGVVLMYALALCWLEATSHNQAIRQQQAAEEQAALENDPIEVDSPLSMSNVVVQSEPTEPLPPYQSAGHEFRHLLRYATLAMMICGGWIIWADVLPALHILDRVQLWQNIETVAEAVTSTNGTESVQMVDHNVPTTLMDLLKAIMICMGTIMIGRRLPGLLDLTVMERLPVDQGGRQALAILIRYAATLAGLLLACHIIRLSWSSVQWLAAAMTVGLGFGLQEIFANLVSGIIILFERPIRMGDLVTVGDITGNITKMQIRATTITDFDRRELIVPNKKFITDNVINWTLSDPISRVVLPVGVAYGTDIKQVETILMRIARECSYVMREPGPGTLFKGFGDSTLDVELRVFIPTREMYVNVVNFLNNAIAREFKKAEIEIAFPQRDLHIKSLESLEALMPDRNAASTKVA